MLPAAISQLSMLSYLSLANNNLGFDPSSASNVFDQFTSTITIDVGYNNFSGAAVFQHGRFTRLEAFWGLRPVVRGSRGWGVGKNWGGACVFGESGGGRSCRVERGGGAVGGQGRPRTPGELLWWPRVQVARL